jgi:hypothetical protein
MYGLTMPCLLPVLDTRDDQHSKTGDEIDTILAWLRMDASHYLTERMVIVRLVVLGTMIPKDERDRPMDSPEASRFEVGSLNKSEEGFEKLNHFDLYCAYCYRAHKSSCIVLHST